MALVQTFQLPHLPDYPIFIALFKDVESASFLRQQLLEGNPDFEYAFLDATMVLSTRHALAATFRAINDMLNNRLKSRNVHSEIVFSFNPNNNITDSFRHFGIQSATKTLLAIKVSTPATSQITQDSVAQHLSSHVTGTPFPFNDDSLASITDVARVRKVYKLSADAVAGGSGPGKKGRKGLRGKEEATNGTDGVNGVVDVNGVRDEVDERKEMEAVVLGIMALKGS